MKQARKTVARVDTTSSVVAGRRSSAKRRNAGVGQDFIFHGAFTQKADAVRKEQALKARGAHPFIQFLPYPGGFRFAVVTAKGHRKMNPGLLSKLRKFARSVLPAQDARHLAGKRHPLLPPKEAGEGIGGRLGGYSPPKGMKPRGKKIGRSRDREIGRSVDPELVSALQGLGYKKDVARGLAQRAQGATFDEKLRSALRKSNPLHPKGLTRERARDWYVAQHLPVPRKLLTRAEVPQEEARLGKIVADYYAQRNSGKKRRRNLFGFGGGSSGKTVVTREAAQAQQRKAARTLFEKGEYRQAKKVARMSPRRFAKRAGFKREGILRRTARRTKARIAGAAHGAVDRLLGNPQRNQDGELAAAKKLHAKFHGAPSRRTLTPPANGEPREDLAGLGHVSKLIVAAVELHGAKVEISFTSGEAPLLASDPKGTQLYLVGGNQKLDDALPAFGCKRIPNAFYELGRLVQIEYRTRKDFDNFQPVTYFHAFGEDTGEQPALLYDSQRQKLWIAGGAYKVKREGIVN